MRRRNVERVLFHIGRRVAELRQERIWTQEVLAEHIGCSVKWVQTVERGQANLSVRALAKFADVFKKDVRVLFEPPSNRRRAAE